jgi:hypothetical protein
MRAEYRGQVGRITPDATIPKLREFIMNGGTVMAIGTSASNLAASNLAAALELPVENALVENGAALPHTKFYAPGSVLSVHVDTRNPLGAGLPRTPMSSSTTGRYSSWARAPRRMA